MEKDFIGYYRPSESEIKDLWQNGLFILDASILLNLYRYPIQARDDLLGIFKRVSDRLWAPHQSMLEFEENRLSVIADQVKRFDDVKELLRDTQDRVHEQLSQMQLKKRHSSIDPDEFLKELDGVFKRFEDKLEKLSEGQTDVYEEDHLRTKINSLLNEKIGKCPFSQEQLDCIYTEGKLRYDQKRPPGFLDEEKEKYDSKYHFCNGMSYYRKFGDLILWFEIIDFAKTNKIKKIVFLTDDDKEDWWWKIDSKGKKIIGPRPELVNEIREKANVELFYMYNSERFMQHAKPALAIEVNSESIKQVKESAEPKDSSLPQPIRTHIIGIEIENYVLNWIRSSYPGDEIIENKGFPDFIRIGNNGIRIGYEVKYTNFPNSVALDRSFLRALNSLADGLISSVNIIIFTDSEKKITLFKQLLKKFATRLQRYPIFIYFALYPVDYENSPVKFET